MRSLLLIICCLGLLPAASSWQRAEEAARIAETDIHNAIARLQDLLLDEPELHVAHYNLACILLNYQWQAEDDQRFGSQTRKLAKQALNMSELPDIDPLALAAEHFQRAVASPVKKLAARAWHNLALARYKQGRLEDALAAAVKACELFPQEQAFLQTRNELRRVFLERADEARRKAEEEAKRLRIIQAPLPDAFEGKSYTAQIQAKGGAGEPYMFSLGAEQTLPEGLKLPPPEPTATASRKRPESMRNDTIIGIPNSNAVGEHQIKFIVKDSADATDEAELSIKVWPKPKITTEHLNEAIIQQSYLAELHCVGLPHPTWFIEGLPKGLKLKQNTGPRVSIGGTAEELGTFTLNMTVRDDKNDLIAVHSLPLVVSDSFAPDTTGMPPATAWSPYTHQLSVRGPTQQYKYFSQGAGGFTIDEQGLIGGTPEEQGDVDFPLSIKADDGRERSFVLQMKVNPPPVIAEEAEIKLNIGQSLQRKLKVEGGTAPYTWTLVEGLLPDGVRLDESGYITGAASLAEEAPVTIAVEDRWSSRGTKEIKLIFEAKDPNQQQEQQDQQQQNQENQEQNQDQQNQEDQGQNQQQTADQQENQENQQEQNDAQAAQQEAQDQQEGQIKQADVQRWLDSLPEESKRALLMQLLDGKHNPQPDKEPW